MAISEINEQMAHEYATEYCSTHGGNFTYEELVSAYISGTRNEKRPQRFQAFLAWQQGMRQGGWILK